MRFLKILLALIFTIVLLVVARKLSSREPEYLEVTANGTKLSHTTVIEKIGPGKVKINANLSAPQSLGSYSLELFYRMGEGEYTNLRMNLIEGTSDQLSTFIPSQTKGKRAYYYLSLSDSQGKRILTLPEKIDLLNDPLLIKFKGEVSPAILIAHIVAMFASIFFVVLVLFSSLEVLWGKDSLRQLSIHALFTTILSFLGGVPLGILVTNQTFGEYWGGFPIFTDVTDSKTSIMIIYWIIFLSLIKGSAFKKDKSKNLLSDKALAFFGILGFTLTLAIYLVPHSL